MIDSPTTPQGNQPIDIHASRADVTTPPATWNQLALRVAWETYRDVHVKLPAILALIVWAYGAANPELKDACNDLATRILTYLSGAAMVSLSVKKGTGTV